MFNFNRKILFLIFLVCLIALGAEFFYILINGIHDSEELLFEFLAISFLFTISLYLINSIFKKSSIDKESEIDF